MLTRRLHKAYKEVSDLADFLAKRDWERTSELVSTLEKADSEINQIVEKAIKDALEKTEHYSNDAQILANLASKMKEPESYRRKARGELARINKTVRILEEMVKE